MLKLNDTRIVGLSGFIGSGKSTVADILSKYDFIPIAYADKVKDVVSIVFGWDRAMLEGDTTVSREFRNMVDPYWSDVLEREITPRKALQLVGTEAFRDVIHPSIWVNALVKEVTSNPDKKYVITDCRFVNEIKAVKDLNGFMMRVKKGDDPEWYSKAERYNQGEDEMYLDLLTVAPHPSEWNWIGSKFDLTVHNDSTIKHLKKNIDSLFDK